MKKTLGFFMGAMLVLFFAAGCVKSNPSTVPELPTVTFTSTATPYCSPTPAVTPASVFFHFASDLEGFTYVANSAAVDCGYLSDPAVAALGTTGSAYVYCDFYPTDTRAYFTKYFSPFINLTGKTIKASLYVPEELANLNPPYSAYIVIIPTGYAGGQGIAMGGFRTLNTPGWHQLAYTPSTYSNTGEASVSKVGVVIQAASPYDWYGTVYVDEISW